MDITKVKLNQEQKSALEKMLSGKNIFLTGRAGTGKSFLINYYLELCKTELNKTVVVCAPTGIAASIIGGATLHSAFSIPIGPVAKDPEKFPEILLWANAILIDEISMCRIDVFEYIMKQVQFAEWKRNRKLPVIVVGDFYQLPPVLIEKDRKLLKEYYRNNPAYNSDGIGSAYAFQSRLWKFEHVELKQVMRQDDEEYVMALQRIRKGIIKGVDWIKEHSAKEYIPGAVWIVPKNEEARQINEYEMSKLDPKTERIYNMTFIDKENLDDEDMKNLMAEVRLRLRIGTRVIATVNAGQFVNGSLGTVTGFDNLGVIVKFDEGKEVVVENTCWDVFNYALVNSGETEQKLDISLKARYCQIPLRPAWALTIHKSQGQTFAAANIKTDTWAEGQLYTAFSRVSDVSKVYIDTEVNMQNLIASQEVIDLYADPENYHYDWAEHELLAGDELD